MFLCLIVSKGKPLDHSFAYFQGDFCYNSEDQFFQTLTLLGKQAHDLNRKTLQTVTSTNSTVPHLDYSHKDDEYLSMNLLSFTIICAHY